MVRAMRVAVDATPLLGVQTGVGLFCSQLVAGLADRPDIDLTAYALSGRSAADLVAHVPPGVATSTGRHLPAGVAHRLWRRWSRPRAEDLVGAVDVVHGTNFVVPPTRSAAAVVSVHDLTTVRFPEMATDDTRRFPALVRAAIERGAWVHTLSRFVGEEVVDQLGADPARVVPVHLGVPPLPEVRAGAGVALAGASEYVLALGTVEPRKGLPTLVTAFGEVAARHRDLHLVIAGSDGWGSDQLTGAIWGAQHRQRIRRLGYVTGEQRAALLTDAAALAFPSVYEGFGFPPLEAMTVGTPVVASTAGAIPEVTGDAAELVPPRDPGALAAALLRVLDDADHRHQLVLAGHQRAALFTWPDCVDGLADLYGRAWASRA